VEVTFGGLVVVAPTVRTSDTSPDEADNIVADAVAAGFDAVFPHPSAVYGSAPSSSPGVNELISKLVHVTRGGRQHRRRRCRGRLDAVFPHPSAVYGPAPSNSPGVNELSIKLWNNKARRVRATI